VLFGLSPQQLVEHELGLVEIDEPTRDRCRVDEVVRGETPSDRRPSPSRIIGPCPTLADRPLAHGPRGVDTV
jgi:hypothetical protein